MTLGSSGGTRRGDFAPPVPPRPLPPAVAPVPLQGACLTDSPSVQLGQIKGAAAVRKLMVCVVRVTLFSF